MGAGRVYQIFRYVMNNRKLENVQKPDGLNTR